MSFTNSCHSQLCESTWHLRNLVHPSYSRHITCSKVLCSRIIISDPWMAWNRLDSCLLACRKTSRSWYHTSWVSGKVDKLTLLHTEECSLLRSHLGPEFLAPASHSHGDPGGRFDVLSHCRSGGRYRTESLSWRVMDGNCLYQVR